MCKRAPTHIHTTIKLLIKKDCFNIYFALGLGKKHKGLILPSFIGKMFVLTLNSFMPEWVEASMNRYGKLFSGNRFNKYSKHLGRKAEAPPDLQLHFN